MQHGQIGGEGVKCGDGSDHNGGGGNGRKARSTWAASDASILSIGR